MKGLLLSFFFTAGIVQAGQMTFLGDGKRVVFAGEGKLMVRELETGEESPMALPEGFKDKYPQVAWDVDVLYVAGGREVYSRTLDGKWKREFEIPKDAGPIEDIAVNPKDGPLVVVTRDEKTSERRWWVWLTAGLRELQIRNVDYPQAPAFDAEGNLYFCAGYDVWKGAIGPGQNKEWPLALEGVRYWPVGERKTSGGNGAGTGAREILPLSKFMLVCNHRIGGSGWGSIDRFPNASAWTGKVSLEGITVAPAPLNSAMALSPDGRHAALWVTEPASDNSHAKRWYQVNIETGEVSPFAPPAPEKKKK